MMFMMPTPPTIRQMTARLLDQNRPAALAVAVLRAPRRADDLLGRDAVHLLGINAHKTLTAAGTMPVPAKRSSSRLEHLEEQIDECLTAARSLDREGQEHVIRLLRQARNEVVWKLGQ
jgi:hypothetical protein